MGVFAEVAAIEPAEDLKLVSGGGIGGPVEVGQDAAVVQVFGCGASWRAVTLIWRFMFPERLSNWL